MNYNGQIAQDLFVLKVLNNKRNGTFLEIGSNHPIQINNTYLLEKDYSWRGIMVDYDSCYIDLYKIHRPLSKWLIADATTIDYASELEKSNMPHNMDYLQIDLEVSNNSTLNTLSILDNTVFDIYTFATVTFEHDIYAGNYFNTREESRNIFKKRGYVLVFPDVKNNGNMFEDWYVHPDLVDMTYINTIKSDYALEYTDIIKRLTT